VDVMEDEKLIIIANREDYRSPIVLHFDSKTWREASILLRDKITRRSDPFGRVEKWECKNEHGVYDDDIFMRLTKRREKLFTDKKNMYRL
jgi:hypothetical protein